MASEPWYANMRPTLFMTMPLEQAETSNAQVSDSGFGGLASASHMMREGRRDEAEAVLEAIWRRDAEDPRIRLWAANALRSVGGSIPHESASRTVLGVVLEIPVRGGIDTVAAYRDGTFRYYNAVRGAVVVEPGGASIVNEAAKDLVSAAAGSEPASVKPHGTKISFLTPAGVITIDDSTNIGTTLSLKALKLVQTCMHLRDSGSAAGEPPDK